MCVCLGESVYICVCMYCYVCVCMSVCVFVFICKYYYIGSARIYFKNVNSWVNWDSAAGKMSGLIF